MKIDIYSPTIRRKEMDAVLTAMVEEKIGPGDRNKLLIQTSKEILHFDYALALRSPAVALHLALKALNAKPGKAVIISALSPCYYLQVLQDLQLTPVLCDVTYDFPCMSREIIENTIAKKDPALEVCAVVLHHTLGFTPDSEGIAGLGFPVIEDISKNCESGKTKGVICFLGLEERDMLTSGGGALLFTMNKKDSSMLRSFSGIPEEYALPDINAALAVVQFKELQRNMERRRDIAEIYLQASLRTRHKRFISINDNDYCNYAFSLVLETGLKDVTAYARKKDIEIGNAFGNTIAGAASAEDCPVSNSLVLRTVLFPMYPRLRSNDVDRISRLIMTLP